MKAKISEIADIQLGYQFRKKIEPTDNGTNWAVQIRDFDENRILDRAALVRVRIEPSSEKYLINKGDILFLSRGHRNWAATIVDDLTGTVAVSHFFVVRPKHNKVLSEYLTWYLNQSPAQEYLHNIARQGTHMPLIPLSAFVELQVDLPDIETQAKIVGLNGLMEKEKQLLSALQEKRAHIIKSVCLSAAKAKKEKRK